MATTIEIGEIFDGRYELLEVLGSGGQSTVYKARQLDFDRTIALKVVRYTGFDDEDDKQRFLREASILSSLSHANIVTIYHIGFCGDIPYLAMELINGESVQQRIEREGSLPADLAFGIIDQCATALSAIHNAGIVHRDVKPANIVLVDKPEVNTVKLIDFGLARLTAREQKLTQTGTLIGSAHYMSPEQCRGEHVDSHSDIYSLTVCMYEMLTGSKPYDADNTMGVMYKQINEPVPLLPSESFTDEQIDAFIRKGMAKEPADRFQSMAELSAALKKIEPTKESRYTVSKSRRSKHPHPVILLAGLCLLGFGLSVAAFQLYKKSAETIHKESAVHIRQVNTRRPEPNKKAYEWVKLTPWDVGTWHCTSKKVIEYYNIRTKDPNQYKYGSILPGDAVRGHQKDEHGNVWHLNSIGAQESWNGPNVKRTRLSYADLEAPIRDEHHVRRHYKEVLKETVVTGNREWTAGVVSYDIITETVPIDENHIKMSERSIIQSDTGADLLRIEMIWKRVKPFEETKTIDGMDLRQSLAAHLKNIDHAR